MKQELVQAMGELPEDEQSLVEQPVACKNKSIIRIPGERTEITREVHNCVSVRVKHYYFHPQTHRANNRKLGWDHDCKNHCNIELVYEALIPHIAIERFMQGYRKTDVPYKLFVKAAKALVLSSTGVNYFTISALLSLVGKKISKNVFPQLFRQKLGWKHINIKAVELYYPEPYIPTKDTHINGRIIGPCDECSSAVYLDPHTYELVCSSCGLIMEDISTQYISTDSNGNRLRTRGERKREHLGGFTRRTKSKGTQSSNNFTYRMFQSPKGAQKTGS